MACRSSDPLASSHLILPRKWVFRIRRIRYDFGPPGSASGSVSHMYCIDPMIRMRIRTKMSRTPQLRRKYACLFSTVPGYHCLIFGFFVPGTFFLFCPLFCVDVPRILVSMAESASRTQTISSASANTPDIQVFSRIFLLIEKPILKVVVFCLGAVCHTSLNWFSCVQFQNRHPDSR